MRCLSLDSAFYIDEKKMLVSLQASSVITRTNNRSDTESSCPHGKIGMNERSHPTNVEELKPSEATNLKGAQDLAKWEKPGVRIAELG